ncbi:MAG: putative RDD family membrane protein YckC [Alteromonadaceae bacterium]
MGNQETFWPRFWAGLIDGLIFIPVYFLDSWFFEHDFSGITNFIYYVLTTSLSYYFYSVYMHGKYGQTLGKMALKIKVISVDGSDWGFKKALYRDLVIIIVAILLLIVEAPEILAGINPNDVVMDNPIFNYLMYAEFIWFLVEFITMFTNNKRRAIHYYIAGSVVIRL